MGKADRHAWMIGDEAGGCAVSAFAPMPLMSIVGTIAPVTLPVLHDQQGR